MSLRLLARLLVIPLLALPLVGCDQGWSLAARNSDDQSWLVRLALSSQTDAGGAVYYQVYRLEPGALAPLEATLGAPPRRVIELLDESCVVQANLQLDPLEEATVVILPGGGLDLQNGYPTDDQLPDERPEVFDKCGGRPSV